MTYPNDDVDDQPDRARLSVTGYMGAEHSFQSKLEVCQQQIGYRFKNLALLQSALTHASGATTRLESNERLEFLGDAILGMVVCEWLFQAYPEASEGELTKIKSTIVSRQLCGRVAKRLQLDECLIVGKGVIRNRSFPHSLVSDVFESIVAAIYLDSDLATVRDFIQRSLKDELSGVVEGPGGNFKSLLQQYAQRELADTPVYRLISESGPDHRKLFSVAAQIGERIFTAASGRNKKVAEQRAAANALAELEERELPFQG